MSHQQRQILKLLAAQSAVKEDKKDTTDDLSLDSVGLIFMGVILLIPVFILLANKIG